MNERDLFIAALQIDNDVKRAAYLDEVCADDAELRTRVEALLTAFSQAGSFLQQPAVEPGVTIDPTHSGPLESAGTMIGPYKLLEQIGEGGFGIVFLADQQRPVQRRVAVKIIKPGMDSRLVIARFAAERQALALMDHPNIARVLDAGTTAPNAAGYPGRPYFVMELVKGVPITQYCDQHRLTPKQRLELFIPVCQAVQHAHQKGIIHRDIKPSNVMVCLYDGEPVPKVIDFGVAKAMGAKLTDATAFTQFGQVVGTLEYMSPEQAELNQLDIDTRSDIYALGVLLYELLTGTTPLQRQQLAEAAFMEALRRIREEDPPKPSTRLSTSDSLPSVAANRSLEPKKLSGAVRGELDWIVMKCLDKQRGRRYETANGLANDVQRYLNDEQVLACPPSTGYRFRKFARRNKEVLTAGALVVLALLLGTVISIWQAALAHRANTLAQERLEAEKLSRADAETQRRAAVGAEKKAKEQEQLARQNETHAREQELLARRRFYASQIHNAYQAWENGESARTLELLESQRPTADEPDLRSFEWYQLWRLCQEHCRFILRGHLGSVSMVRFSPDGKMIASASTDGTARLWDTRTGKERLVLSGHALGVWAVAFSSDGRLVATASSDGTARIWDVETGRELKTLRHSETDIVELRGIAFSPDGKLLATVGHLNDLQGGVVQGGGRVKLWDAATFTEQATLTGADLCVAFSADGTKLAAGSMHGWAKLWLLEGSEWCNGPTIRSDGEVVSVAFSPDGATLAISGQSLTTMKSVVWQAMLAFFPSKASFFCFEVRSNDWTDTTIRVVRRFCFGCRSHYSIRCVQRFFLKVSHTRIRYARLHGSFDPGDWPRQGYADVWPMGWVSSLDRTRSVVDGSSQG